MLEIDIAPCDEAALGVAEPRHEIKLEACFFGWDESLE